MNCRSPEIVTAMMALAAAVVQPLADTLTDGDGKRSPEPPKPAPGAGARLRPAAATLPPKDGSGICEINVAE
jgi:hypothetical protein